jgi:pimeloyl-ACP methyl ester carboxylesterase
MSTDHHRPRNFSKPLTAVALLMACSPSPDPISERSAQSTVTSADGVRIAYEVHGEGSPAVILVHGWSCDRSYWRQQVGALATQRTIVAVDLAGHGESGTNRDQWTIESFGRDIALVADTLGLQEIILVGHSMGGDVILEAALQLAGRVNGLVWVDTYQRLGSPRTMEEVNEIVASFRSDFVAATSGFVPGLFPASADSALVRRVTGDMASAPPHIGIATMQASLTYGRQVTTPIQALGLPIIAINPENPPTDVPSLEQYGVTVVPMTGVGHFMMLEDPEGFNALLENVIRRLEAEQREKG